LIANFDFYSTIASVIGQPVPKHCDGVNLLPYLRGEKGGDAHEYLFWLNNEPGDAERRHLIAARWKNWRLYKKYSRDVWQLFDLEKDPMEETNLANKHPKVVSQIATKHEAWKRTLAPLAKIPQIVSAKPIIPKGHGWARPDNQSQKAAK
jgi:arylsulfatase A-like enzyme